MAFIRKHLPDKFYQEGDQRISLRDRIFREVVSNMLIHREFANAFPSKLIIEKDIVLTENWNRPHEGGIIDPTNFSPFPKNPVIAKFFKEIGRVDELGSGVRNTFKYCGIYSPGTKPEFIEDDVFRIIIPLKAQDVNKGRKKVGENLTENQKGILEAMRRNSNISAKKISEIIGISERKTETNIANLKKMDLIIRIGPDKGGYWKINI